MRLSLKELRERRERGLIAVEDRRPSGIPVEVVLVMAGTIERPVALARALTGFGLGLAEAHDALNRIVGGERVSVTLLVTPGGELSLALGRFGVAVWYPVGIGKPPELVTLRDVAPGVQSAIESWRLSRPDQPAPGEAVGLILQEYLTEHGYYMPSEEEPQEVRLYQTE